MMTLFEILNGPLSAVASSRFLKNFKKFARGYPTVTPVFKEFIEFKIENPYKPFGGKDTLYAPTGPLRGSYHVHLVHGKVICVYGITGSELRLYDIIEHDGQEAQQVRNLGKFINSLGSGDFIQIKDEEPETNTRVDISDIKDFIFSLAASPSDRPVLLNALRGDFSEIYEYAEIAEVDLSKIDRNTFMEMSKTILKQLGLLR